MKFAQFWVRLMVFVMKAAGACGALPCERMAPVSTVRKTCGASEPVAKATVEPMPTDPEVMMKPPEIVS